MASSSEQIRLDEMGFHLSGGISKSPKQAWAKLWDKYPDPMLWEVIWRLRTEITRLEHPEWYNNEKE